MTYVIPGKKAIQTIHNGITYFVNYYNEVLSTDAPQDTYENWNSTISYTQDAYVKVDSLKRIYRCASSSSLNQYPPENPTIWVDYGADNSYKMFDDIIGSQTEFNTQMQLSISANSINSLALLNLDSIVSIHIVQVDNYLSDIVYDEMIYLADYGVDTLYEYWYKPLSFRRDLFIGDLSFSTDSTLNIAINGGSTSKVGAVLTGISDTIGITLYGSKIKLKDYSKYVADDYGNMTFSKRGFARIINAQAVIDTSRVDEIIKKVASIRGGLTLFIGDETSDGFSSMTTLGYIENLELSIDDPSKTAYPISIVGVT